MQKNRFNSILLKQKVAIGSYLDQLLHEATNDPLEQDAEDKIISLVQQENPIASELLIAENENSQSIVIVESKVANQQDSVAETVPMTLEPDIFPLQCLMFRVKGNLLSAPLIRMKSVIPWSDHLTILPQSPGWMLGLLKYHNHNVRVVDSSQVLGINSTPESVPSHILILGSEDWAITCDKLEDVITLEYSDIQWNQRCGDAMIFGTIRNSLASLLNPDGIVESLSELI